MFFHVGANSNQRVRVYIATIGGQALQLIDSASKKRSISTVGQANAMIGYVDSALEKLNRQRADLGSYFNRMENTIRALTRSYENMMAADSRVRDVDMAAEMVEYTRDQILIQNGVAMLAQANFKPKLILKLLES
jgi:flagellin